MRATDIRTGVLQGRKFAVAIFLSAMLRLWAHHESGEAADGVDQRPADLPVSSESRPTGGASHDLARGLVGRWTFDEGKGTISHDSSGRGNHGTVMGGAKWAEGRIGGALEFDGQDDFVSIPNESRFDITGSITVAAWIRVESFTKAWQSIVTKGDRAWRLHRASDTSSVGWACSDLSRQQVGDLFGKTEVTDGQWHYVAGVLDGTKTSIFVDGELDASTNSSPSISVNDFSVLIGANAQVKGRLFHGLIDDVRIYDRALSVDELWALSRGGGAAAQPPSQAARRKPDADRKGVMTAGPVNVARIVSPDSWSEFRGPRGDGHSDSEGLPLRWSESKSENITWKTRIHGRGWSSPILWGQQVWMTTATADGHKLSAVCVDRDSGKIVHDIHVFDVEQPQPIASGNSYASPTPAIEEGRVYVHYGTYGTACLDTATGNRVWERRDLKCDHESGAGPGSSPALVGDLFVVNVDGRDVQYVIALNKANGKTVWKTDRSVDFSQTPVNQRKAFCTPIVVPRGSGNQLVSPGAKALIAYDTATGNELWKVRHRGFSVAPRPVFGHGLVFALIDHDSPELWAVRADGSGDVTDSHVVWKMTQGMPSRSSPLLIGDLLFVVNNDGIASCLEARTGELVWKQRIGGNYSASPVCADGRIYFFNENAVGTVIQPSGKFEVLAVNPLHEEQLLASPAVAGRSLFVRTEKHLYRIEEPVGPR